MTHEEMREALEASSLFRNSRISMEEMRERRCRKGQILTDRKKGEGILGLIAGGKVEDVYKRQTIPALTGLVFRASTATRPERPITSR